jgi:mRNA interferase RelE/StbE
MLESISDERVRRKIIERVKQLSIEPDNQGKALLEELAGFRSIRAVGQRYRIIYRIKKQQVVVLVMAVGLRKQGSAKDVYTLAKKLIKLRLLEPEGKD